MKYFSLVFILLFPFYTQAQKKKESAVKLKLSGFVKTDYIFDTRQNAEAREGFYIAYPKPIVLDANGIDINDFASASQYAMTTRLGLTATGPEILQAKSKAYIETDFTGPSNMQNNALRLRHAYIRLDWENTSFLMGQYWHPLDVPEMMPMVLSLNSGAPMHSFSRGPQIRVTQKTGAFNWIAVVYSQRDYASNGPNGYSNQYLRNSAIPDLSLQLHYSNRLVFAGAGINYKQLNYRSFTLDNKLLNDDISSLSTIAFIKLKNKKWDARLEAVWGENLYDHLMLGGVAIAQIDSVHAQISYTNLPAASIWGTFNYKFKKLKVGVFGGYIKSLGSSEIISGPVYARGFDIDYIYRISPQLSYKIKNLILANEWEYTVAAYGEPDAYGKVQNSYEVGNLRFTLSLIYLL